MECIDRCGVVELLPNVERLERIAGKSADPSDMKKTILKTAESLRKLRERQRQAAVLLRPARFVENTLLRSAGTKQDEQSELLVRPSDKP